MPSNFRNTLLCFSLPAVALGQIRTGTVCELGTSIKLKGIRVENRQRGLQTSTNEAGCFSIEARVFDTLVCSGEGQRTFRLIIRPAMGRVLDTIFLLPEITTLKEVPIYSPFARLQQDSIAFFTLYRKVIADANRKAKAYFDTPAFRFKVDGLITEGIWALSGEKKRNRQLKADFYKINQDRFVNVVYNIQKVKAIIPEDDSVLTKFIKSVPMPYEVARGGEYQQLVWIRREWKRYRCGNEDKE